VTQPIERSELTDAPAGAEPDAAAPAGPAEVEPAWPRRGAQPEPAPPGPGDGLDPQLTGPPGPRVSNPTRLAIMAGVLVLAYLQFGLSAFYIVGALLVSIILHELGHYLVAKRSGMKVSEFFVGFGPRLWSIRRGETEYGLKAIPAGAYVRIVGMNDFEEVDAADESRTYRAQGTFKRLFTVLAGPAANLIIAFVLMTILFLAYGRESDTWTVEAVQSGSAAASAGLAPGDRLVAVDGEPIGEWDAFRAQLSAKAGRQVNFSVERDGTRVEQAVALGWRLSPEAAAGFPAQPALSPGDVITAADGTPLTRYEDLRTLLAEPGAPVSLRVVRARHDYDLKVDRPLALPEAGAAGFLGVEPTTDLVKETPVGAVGETLRVLRDGVVATGGVFQRLFSPSGITNYASQVADATQPTTTLAPNSVGRLTPVGDSPQAEAASTLSEDRPISIVGIFLLGREAAGISLASFLLVIAGVNLALAIINLVPMLPLDGGHAVIAIYEGIRGRLQGVPYRADLTKLMPFVYGFIAILVLLGGSTMLLDVLRPPSLR
jgi:RIP metalloprotease RseP